MYTERTIPHVYRKSDPTCIQEAPTTVYRKNDPSSMQKKTMADVYRKNDPTSIQKEPSWALNEVTID